MNLKSRLAKLENEIDVISGRNPDDPRLEELEAQADKLADELTAIDEIILSEERAKKAAHQAKIDDIRNLDKLGRTDDLINKYGDEFVDDYCVDTTITSLVSDEQWTVDDTHKKLRQLLYYRIYDTYIRVRT
jgi:hypothetical protein